MKAKLYTTSGKVVKEVSLPMALFGKKVKPLVLAQAVRVLSARQHSGTAFAKTRGDVNRTTAKVYAQKHTGRARHGARSAPIYVGGGVAHGPKGLAGKSLKLTRKLRRLSVLGALNYLATQQKIALIDELDQTTPQARNMAQLIEKTAPGQPVLLLTAQIYPSLSKAAKNVANVTLMPALSTNALYLLRTKYLLVDQKALPSLEAWLIGTEVKKTTKSVTLPKPSGAKKSTKKK